MAGLKLNKSDLMMAALDFSEKYNYQLGACDLDRGDCDFMSNVFADWIEAEYPGVDAKLLMGQGFIPPLGKDAEQLWLMLSGSDAFKKAEKPLNHVVVQVGNYVVDLTGRQFGVKYSTHIYPVSVFKKRWKHTGYVQRANRQVNDLRRMMLTMSRTVAELAVEAAEIAACRSIRVSSSKPHN